MVEGWHGIPFGKPLARTREYKDRNFHFNLACRHGYDDAARRIQDAFLEGRREAAIAAVPDALVDEVALCGLRERIADRLEA